MLYKLIVNLCAICILTKTSSTQYYASQYYQNIAPFYQRPAPEQEISDYEEPVEQEFRRYGRPTKLDSRDTKDEDEYDDDEYNECKCSCRLCQSHPQKTCCNEVCRTCEEIRRSQTEPQVQVHQLQNEGSILFVPFPYPIMGTLPISNVIKTITTTIAPITTEKQIARQLKNAEYKSQVEVEQQRKKDESINELDKTPSLLKGEDKYILATVRKTKPAWQPKYGIVAIPDTLAEKLINQLKQDQIRKM